MSARRGPVRQHPRLPTARTLATHAGEWVAIVDRKVVASGDRFREVLAKARESAPGRDPSMLRVPTDNILLL